MAQVKLHCRDVLLQFQSPKAPPAAAMAMDIDKAGRQVQPAAIHSFIGFRRRSRAIACNFPILLQQPAIFQQPVRQNQGCVDKNLAHVFFPPVRSGVNLISPSQVSPG